MPIREIDPEDAHAERLENADAVLLDVRTAEEFEAGHPEGAINVPVVLPTPMGMQPNPEFMQAVRDAVPQDARVLISCQSGQRSMMACQMMAQSGWQDLANVRAGFGGIRDMSGNILEPGWEARGLPVATGPSE